MEQQFRQFIHIFLSFLVAWLFTILPLSSHWQWIQPKWLTLVLIYWIFALPQSIGIMAAWSVGLVLDILKGELLGQYALSMVIVALLARALRYRLFPFWQQAAVIFILIGTGDLALFLIQWLIGHPPRSALYWVSSLSSVLLWPWVYRVLRLYERRLFV